MKSPFPGMDPYLERYWGDVHASLMVYLRDQINELLPADLQARVEETVSVDAIDGDSRWLYPDVQVVEEPAALEYAPAVTVVGAAEPRLIAIPAESRTQRHLEIIDPNSGNRVVTAIEVLSPANKASESGRRLYRNKQRDYIQGRVNLVEIDLIRAGQFILAVPESTVPDSCRATYMICVRRVVHPHRAELYPIPLRDPLPAIRIPLRPNDTDLLLQLQPLIQHCYQSGRYDRIDYRQPLRPPLDADDQPWADTLLREWGLAGLSSHG
jgi:hypothetical protein